MDVGRWDCNDASDQSSREPRCRSVLPDAQQLSFLSPQTHEFEFDISPAAYGADGARALKLVFGAIGEIDFIVAPTLTSSPTVPRILDGESVLLETIPEIIVKKIFYRAARLTARDFFDLAVAGEQYEGSLIKELRRYPEQVAEALARTESLHADFVIQTVLELEIKAPYREIAASAIERSK